VADGGGVLPLDGHQVRADLDDRAEPGRDPAPPQPQSDQEESQCSGGVAGVGGPPGLVDDRAELQEVARILGQHQPIAPRVAHQQPARRARPQVRLDDAA
jgi:hypothetical protein